MRRILFVDDEPMVLAGLRRSLYFMCQEWEMQFVSGGQEALETMARQPFDAVVTDMRMPVMNGAQLLDEVRQRYPQCLRFVLSGQADQQTILKTVTPAHQFLAKPCEGTELKDRLTRALAMRDLLHSQQLRGLIAKLESLPSLPALYDELTRLLTKGDASVTQIGKLVSQDIALTAKMLQLVNSAFFGLRTEVCSAVQAVQLLGVDTIRGLLLSTHVFSAFQTDLLSQADLQYLWNHSMTTASYAREIAVLQGADRSLTEECFTAGLLHDSGKLILACALHDVYSDVLSNARRPNANLNAIELELLGCGHADVAAYLLGLWGLPNGVIEGVAWHDRPAQSNHAGLSSALATHLASVYAAQRNPYWLQDGTALDVRYLANIGFLEKEPAWRAAVLDLPTETPPPSEDLKKTQVQSIPSFSDPAPFISRPTARSKSLWRKLFSLSMMNL
jgi:HD-like signal output (HDOD) protein/CheY-like chemotaxis protein